MKVAIAGKPLEIIEDDDEFFIRVLVHESEQGDHTWTFHEIPAAVRHQRSWDRLG
ncbi:MAG: hypothetical protein AAGJ91_11535 [Pseudomonadota bacterium]